MCKISYWENYKKSRRGLLFASLDAVYVSEKVITLEDFSITCAKFYKYTATCITNDRAKFRKILCGIAHKSQCFTAVITLFVRATRLVNGTTRFLDPQGLKTPEQINIKLDRSDYTCENLTPHANFGISTLMPCPCPVTFYRAALNAGRSNEEKAICPSVRLSLKPVNCDKPEESSAQIFIPYEISFSLVFWEKYGGGDPFYLKLWVNRLPPASENADFQ